MKNRLGERKEKEEISKEIKKINKKKEGGGGRVGEI